MRKYVVTLTRDERDSLSEIVSKGKHPAQKVLNALILPGSDESDYQTNRSTNEDLSRFLNISMRKTDRVKKRFVEKGFDAALFQGKNPIVHMTKKPMVISRQSSLR
jgi:hypothetical protein